MKTTTRIKKINGQEYLYEITYYYDKEAKRTRQKSRYLGKNIDGKPVKVREKAKSPESVYAFGEFIPYLSALKQFQIPDLLSEYLTEYEIKTLITVTLACLINPQAIHNPGSWADGTVLSRIYSRHKIKPQSFGKLLTKLGTSSLPLYLCKGLHRQYQNDESIIMDFFVENHESQVFPKYQHTNSDRFSDQISLLYDKDNVIPNGYLPHPKNLTTSDLIKSTLTGMNQYNVKKGTLISGRSFLSSLNIYTLLYSNIPFIIPIDPRHELIQNEIKNHKSELMQPKNLMLFQGETIFVIPLTLTYESVPVHGYIYYSPRREETERNTYEEDLDLILKSLQATPVYRWMDPAETIRDIAGSYEPLIQWKVEEGKMHVDAKKKTATRILRDAGIFIIIYGGAELQWDECLKWIVVRERDEELLNTYIKRLFTYPQLIVNDALQEGVRWVAYLCLFLTKWVQCQMQRSGLLNVSSPEKIFLELEKIRLVGLGNDKTIVTGIGQKQNNILSSMKWTTDLIAL